MTAKQKLLAATMISCLLTLMSLFVPPSQVRAVDFECHDHTFCRNGCEPTVDLSQCLGAFNVASYCLDACE